MGFRKIKGKKELAKIQRSEELIKNWFIETPFGPRKVIAEFKIQEIHDLVQKFVEDIGLKKETVTYNRKQPTHNYFKDWKPVKPRVMIEWYWEISIRRMLAYYFVWTTCSVTWEKWAKYELHIDPMNFKHLELVSENWKFLTLDHANPLSKGWEGWVSNLQVMEAEQNFKKWNGTS